MQILRVNIALNFKFKKLDDLCDQIFDYFHLVYYDLETKIDNELNINSFKSKLETFADKHFKSAIKDFEIEIQSLRNKSPKELIKLEKISSDLNQYYNELVKYKIFNRDLLFKLRKKAKESLSKI